MWQLEICRQSTRNSKVVYSVYAQEHKFGRWFYEKKEKNGVLLAWQLSAFALTYLTTFRHRQDSGSTFLQRGVI